MFSNASLRVGMCYSHDIPRDTWLTVTKITAHGYKADDQCGASEKVELLDCEVKAMNGIKLNIGEEFTIARCGTGPNGEKVFNGHTADGKPCEVVTLRTYTVVRELKPQKAG